MLAGVEDTDGVEGGVWMPLTPLDPFGELDCGIGEGML